MLIDFGRGNQVKSGKSNAVTGMNDCLLSMNLNLLLMVKIGLAILTWSNIVSIIENY